MSELDARCERCGETIPDADLRMMIMAEQENRRQGQHFFRLLCIVCYHEVNSPWHVKEPWESDDSLDYDDRV